MSAQSTPPKPPAQQTPVAKDHPGQLAPKTISADNNPPATDTKQGSSAGNAAADDSGPQVSRIRTWNADTYTRIVIDVGAKVKYQAARISGPDRIYFDIEGAKLSSALLHKPIDIDSGGFLKTVRVAQYQTGVARVVLEVNRVSDYSVFLLPDPYRLVVDVYGTSAAAEAAARNTAPPPGPTTTDLLAAKSRSPPPGKQRPSLRLLRPKKPQQNPQQLRRLPPPRPEQEPAPGKPASNPGKSSQKSAPTASRQTKDSTRQRKQ